MNKFLMFICMLTGAAAQAQDVLVPLNQDVYHLIDRYQIRFSDSVPELHPGVRPYRRKDVAHLADVMARSAGYQTFSLQTDSVTQTGKPFSGTDVFNAAFLLRDNWQWASLGPETNKSKKPFFKHFYRNRSDLYHVNESDFRLRINPVILLEYGKEKDNPNALFTNTRGLQAEGDIGRKIGFYTFLADNQASFPAFVNERIKRDTVLPGEGFYKPFKKTGYDFFTARGYVTVSPLKQVQVQLGYDKNFLGNGYRSLFLSDYAAPYFFLKLNTRVWKFNYQNLFTELTSEYQGANRLFPKKYMSLHHLSLNITPALNVGLYEAVVFARDKGRYELQYLNPIIFYRSIEQQLGSQDNALLGADVRWNVAHTAQVYGQLLLDEFLLSEIKARRGWWANKQAFQLGGKYIDAAGIKNLDLQVEFNYIRPYTYTHQKIGPGTTANYANYSHYEQPLAHPIGANLKELIGIVRYQPLGRLQLTGKLLYTIYGADTAGSNYGTNVLLDYTTREHEYGNFVGQGLRIEQLLGSVTATWQLRQFLYIDARLTRRQAQAALPAYSKTSTFTTVALRWNIAPRMHEF